MCKGLEQGTWPQWKNRFMLGALGTRGDWRQVIGRSYRALKAEVGILRVPNSHAVTSTW